MKSNVIILVFVVIIIVAALIYVLGYFLKKNNQDKLDALEERKINLFDLPVLEEIDDIKKMHLVGQSQNTFREWNQRWQELSTTEFANFESQIFEAENLNETFRLFKVKSAIEEANGTVDAMEAAVEEIRKGLKELRESEERNSLAVQHALDVYDELKKDVKDDGKKFGPALPELKKQLKNIETEFTTFVTLNTSGDPIEARDVLEGAEQKTFEMQDLMKRIPVAYTNLDKTYPDQAKELKETYKKLTTEHYVFPEADLEKQIKNVSGKIQNNLGDLTKIEMDSVERGNSELEEEIDNLYSIMEREMNSKNYVDGQKDTIADYIAHTEKNNRQLLIELDHISQSYALTKNELGRARGFQSQIEEITRQNQEMEPKLKEHTVAFSEVESFYKNTYDVLEDLESQQVEIDKELQELRQGEKVAQEKIDGFEFKLRNLKRYVEKQRLPGLPGDYLEFFFVVTDHVEDLSKELNRIRINMDDVNRIVGLCEEDLTELDQRTHDLVDAAALTEQMMQYANRYRHTNPAIKSAIDTALHLFSQEYLYQEALDEIGTALEKAEPGAFKRIEAFYYDHRDNLS
ncbi:septation ring formation regulator EzrA [Enterococcus nangangensis]|uniref:septation ring formation regulator EzrA n=1 Tax=Enterococcus nangangensis TaxID=2559926 RepID=UPI0010F676D6|nr:septation ring formation regulator EzrA [Enterococcus nangangensis]